MHFFSGNKKTVLVLLAVWTCGLGIAGMWYAYRATTTWQNEDIERRARTIASLIPSEVLTEPWAGAEDETATGYESLKETMRALKRANPDVVLYIMVRRDGVIRFVADSEEPDTALYSPPGQEYTEAPQALHALWERNASYVHLYFTDRWGTWMSGFASILDERGHVVGVVGIDQNGHVRLFLQYASLTGVALIACIVLLLIWSLYRFALNEERTAALKSDFLGMASHELRSPLSAVRWKMAALSRDDKVPQYVREALFDMERHLAHVVNLSSTFLQFTSLDHDLLVEHMRQEVPLTKALWEAVAKVSIQAEQKNITLAYTEATKMLEGVTVFGVEEYISLAIINVVNNAIKYSPDHSEVTIEAWVKEGVVGIVVADRGPGIPTQEMAKMYLPFFRAKNAKMSGKPGTGFGMYATNKVMQFHHGSVHHAPRDGGGTLCTLTFPVYTKTVVE